MIWYKYLAFLFLYFSLHACQRDYSSVVKTSVSEPNYLYNMKDDFEVYIPKKDINAVLILFGSFNETIRDTQREFDILEKCMNHNIALVYTNFNQKLWLSNEEQHTMAYRLQSSLVDNHLPVDNIYIGGFSSGGTISLLLSNYLIENKTFNINPKGVFIIDSPVDLLELYNTSYGNVENNFSNVSVQESEFLLHLMETELGDLAINQKKYEHHAVFTSKSNNISNIKALKNTKLRFYTEPDTIWWQTNRMLAYKHTNAYQLEKLIKQLRLNEFKHVELITTKYKGYRANGERHPHSWSIVDKDELIEWMLN